MDHWPAGGVPQWDREGNRIDPMRWARLQGNYDYRTVAHTWAIPNVVRVSTIWLGLDQSYGYIYERVGHVPLIFETMIFGGVHDLERDLWPTLESAQQGHERWVTRVTDDETLLATPFDELRTTEDVAAEDE